VALGRGEHVLQWTVTGVDGLKLQVDGGCVSAQVISEIKSTESSARDPVPFP